MKTLFKTLIWLVLLIAVAIGVGRSYVLRYWGERDRLLHDRVVAKLRDWFPNAKVELDEVRYDFGSELELKGFALRPAGEDASVVRLPSTVIHLDRDELIEQLPNMFIRREGDQPNERQQLSISKVVLTSPQLQLVRNSDGSWNWQSLLPLPSQKDSSLPEFAIQDGKVIVRIEQAPGIPAGVLTLEHIDIQMVPSGKRQFWIKAVSRCEQTGQIDLSGKWHIDAQTGSLTGQFTEITIGQELLGLVASFLPEARGKLAEIEAKLTQMLARAKSDPNGGANPIAQPTVAANGGLPNSSQASAATDSILGLRALTTMQFRMSRPEADSAPSFRVDLKIRDGQISNPLLPMPLEGLTGEVSANNKFVRVKNLSARNGVTQVAIDGELTRDERGFPGKFQVSAKNIVCDARLRGCLSAGFGRVYDAAHPRGDLDLDCLLIHDGSGNWRPQGVLVTARDCDVIHDAFPYPITRACGTFRQSDKDDKTFLLEMTGEASGRPVTMTGVVKNPGPDAAAQLNIEAQDIPLDAQFVKACRPEIQTVLRQLRASGMLSGEVKLTKLPRQPFVPHIEATVRDGTILYEHFPYAITKLSGELSSVGPNCEFKNFTGQHGAARLTANGSFRRAATGGALQLHAETKQADLDESLFRALPSVLKRVWVEFAPTGRVDCVTDIAWQTGKPVDIRLPKATLSNGSITLKSLPYRIDGVSGQFRYGPDAEGLWTLMIDSLAGRHGDMQTKVSGWQRVETDGNWRARLDEFVIDKLVPNKELTTALSQLPGLKEVFSALDPNQSLSMEGVLELRGTPDPYDPITAAWDLNTMFSGGTIHTGLDLKNLHGLVGSRGSWDGEKAKIEGFVELQSAKILDYVLRDIRGPYRVEEGVLMAGAADIERVRPPGQLAPHEQMTAKIFGGILTLDGVATLTERPKYEVVMNLQNARLEKYAALHLPNYRDLYGETNGWVRIRGVGDSPKAVLGEGQLQISDAALLDMPVMLEMYRRFSLNPPSPQERSFQYALLNFDIRNAAFLFKEIFLQGDTLDFRGQGYVTFNSDADLNFYSQMPRNQVPIPLVREILGEATKGWVGVHITGNLDRPRTEVVPVPLVNEAVKTLLGMRPQPLAPIADGLRKRGQRRQ